MSEGFEGADFLKATPELVPDCRDPSLGDISPPRLSLQLTGRLGCSEGCLSLTFHWASTEFQQNPGEDFLLCELSVEGTRMFLSGDWGIAFLPLNLRPVFPGSTKKVRKNPTKSLHLVFWLPPFWVWRNWESMPKTEEEPVQRYVSFTMKVFGICF